MSLSQLSEICKGTPTDQLCRLNPPQLGGRYFRKFVEETDPDVRTKILEIVPEETHRALQAQWQAREERIKEHRGEEHETLGSEGRPYTQEDVDAYKKAKTQLDLGDWMRSSEMASFFFKHGFALPDQDDSAVLNDALDYQDVKLKIVQQEGYDAHDFNLFDDRSSVLWRKPYIDGAVRELTRSLSPAATSISRARAKAPPAPLVSHSRPVTAARSLRFRLSVSLFFSAAQHSAEFRTSPNSAVPQCGIPHPWSALNGNSAPIPHPVSHFWMGYWEPGEIRLAPQCGQNNMLKGASTGRKLQRSRFCRTLYISQPGQKLEHPCICWIDCH
jgi:hypothetical protein